MSIQLNALTDHPNVLAARDLFISHYKNPRFLQIVRDHGFYLFPWARGTKIAAQILADTSTIMLLMKSCEDEKCKTTASTCIKKKRISFHEHKSCDPKGLEQAQPSLEERVETLMHEYIHTLGYKHMKNKNNSINRRTCPYKIAELFVDFLKKEKKLN